MQVVREASLISVGGFAESNEWSIIRSQIHRAIALVVHPPGTSSLTINPKIHGNGVKSIKAACMMALRDRYEWRLETPITYATKSPGRVDATKIIDNNCFALEWETGNISSSHRAVNKLVLGLIRNVFLGAALVLPIRKLYPYLTDRIGNYEELEPYFDVWKSVKIDSGFLAILVIEHDYTDTNTPLIPKVTDGRALI